MKLEPLDVHGVDDDGVYQPPSLARYRQMQQQMTDLQALNTKLEDERRKYKVLYDATKKMLIAACVEIPIDLIVSGEGEIDRPLHEAIKEIHERNELLEADAWCGATALLREFVGNVERRHEPPERWLREWCERFEAALKR